MCGQSAGPHSLSLALKPPAPFLGQPWPFLPAHPTPLLFKSCLSVPSKGMLCHVLLPSCPSPLHRWHWLPPHPLCVHRTQSMHSANAAHVGLDCRPESLPRANLLFGSLHVVWRMKTRCANKSWMVSADLSCVRSHSSLVFGLDHGMPGGL